MKTPFHQTHSLSRMLHDSVDVMFGNQIPRNAKDLLSTNLHEEGNSFIVSVPVPGMSKEDLNVNLEGRLLIISTKGQTRLSENNSVSTIGRNFKHSFVLPDGVDTNRIHAKCRNGLLTVTIKKLKHKKRHIIIKVKGTENDVSNTISLNARWEHIKDKVNLRKFILKSY